MYDFLQGGSSVVPSVGSVDFTEAINAAVTKALFKQSGNGPPNLKENLLNVKVRFYLSFKWIHDFQVFYNTLNQKMINETKTYDPDLQNGGSLWSSLGGVLSLFLGISFAMLFEVGFSSWISKIHFVFFPRYLRSSSNWLLTQSTSYSEEAWAKTIIRCETLILQSQQIF